MTNEINNTKFYMFLSKFEDQGGWKSVIDGNYGNDDGHVIKSEFRKFMNAEWNGEENGELTNDLINKFWKKIDTNTSASKISGTKLKNLNALDSKEEDNLDKRLEYYLQFDQFVKDNIEIPSMLTNTGVQWKSDVVDELTVVLEKFITDGANGELEAVLSEALPNIANTNTAQYCAVEYQDTLKNSILKEYPEYKVADDNTLQDMIKKYISTIEADTDSETIYQDIMDIMDTYLATAELCEGGDYPLTLLGYDATVINDLQKEVIRQAIKNDLNAEIETYKEKGYEAQFNEALSKYIDAKIKEGLDFNTLKLSANDFANSEYKKELDDLILIDTDYRDIKESTDPNSFYQKLVINFGAELAKIISDNDRYIKDYQAIIDDVVEQIKAKKLEIDSIDDYIIEKITTNLEKFIGGNLSKLSLEALNTTYDKLAKAADEKEDTDTALKQHREAAIKYCDALSGKSNSLKDAVIDTFGTNYSSEINSMYPAEIEEKITELKALALEIGDVSTFTANLDDIKDFSMSPNSTKSLNLNPTILDQDGNIKNVNVTYKYQLSGGGTAVLEGNRLSITASKVPSNMILTLEVVVDGVVIGKKRINIKNEYTQKFDWKSIGKQQTAPLTENTFIYTDGQKRKYTDPPVSLNELYTTNSSITLSEGKSNATEGRSEAIKYLQSFINQIVATCKENGAFEDALNTAAEKTMAIYSQAINSFTDSGKKSSNTRTVTDADGNTYKYETKTYYYTGTAYGDSNVKNKKASNNELGLAINKKYHNTDRRQFIVNVRCLMDLFNKFYEQALQG